MKNQNATPVNIISKIKDTKLNEGVKLAEIWVQIEWYLNNGFSLIPVRDKAENVKGEMKLAKTPYGSWTAYQSEIISKQDLWAQMDANATTAVAIVCGSVSGNLETIDVDVKYQPGIDALLLQDIKILYPELFPKLRIHKTPSGGRHILYRVSGGQVPGNTKLAGREATEEETAADIAAGKRPEKVKNFLETRSEKGYILAPPSLGYSVIQDVPVPVITWEERCSLIALCESYTQIIKVEKAYKPTKADESYYDENPFEHFNNTCDPVALMADFGWDELKHNSRFIWFTRPGKSNGVSASFNLQKRVFWIFTSSSELEASKGYLPSTLLSELQFKGDKKQTYAHLVQQGYGRVKKQIEKRTAKITALRGGKLPANFSDEARRDFEEEQERLQNQYPYGVFWFEEDEIMQISRERLHEVAASLGFKLYSGDPVQIDGFKVLRVDERTVFDTLKSYIKEEDKKDRERILNAYEAFLQRSGKFAITRLPILEAEEFVTDQRDMCFKFYQNGFLAITADGYSLFDYSTIHGLIWAEELQARNFIEADGGKYEEFLSLALNYKTNGAHIRKVIGWLAHNYKDETTGYIIAITEECPDPKQGGGSGKNIFCSLFKNTTTYMSIAGEQVQYNEKFLQSWNGERIFCISDPDRRFKWSFLKELATGVGIIKKLWKNETSVDTHALPKFIVPTNFSFEVSDGGLKRRIISLEFTDYFTRRGGVDAHFGCHFPKGWSEADWAGYDTLTARCIQEWLASGLKLSHAPLTQTGWQKQFDIMYGQLTREFIQENWEYWKREQFISNEKFNDDYLLFNVTNNVGLPFRLSSQKMNKALQDWCEHFGILFKKDHQQKLHGLDNVRGRQFLDDDLF